MRRFYCENENIIDNTVRFDKNESKHISRVLRLEAGEKIIVSTGDGIDRICTLTVSGEECEATVNETVKNENEPTGEIILRLRKRCMGNRSKGYRAWHHYDRAGDNRTHRC